MFIVFLEFLTDTKIFVPFLSGENPIRTFTGILLQDYFFPIFLISINFGEFFQEHICTLKAQVLRNQEILVAWTQQPLKEHLETAQ